MTLKTVNTLQRKMKIFNVAISASVITVFASLTGVLQSSEWSLWDKYFSWRSPEVKDPNIVVVTIDEKDIQSIGGVISDGSLAELLEKIKEQEPRVIGMNLFRNLPIGSGGEELQQVFETTPNLIGTKKPLVQRLQLLRYSKKMIKLVFQILLLMQMELFEGH